LIIGSIKYKTSRTDEFVNTSVKNPSSLGLTFPMG